MNSKILMKTKIVLFVFFINAAYFNSLNASNFNATFFFSELFNPIDSIDYKINILLKIVIKYSGNIIDFCFSKIFFYRRYLLLFYYKMKSCFGSMGKELERSKSIFVNFNIKIGSRTVKISLITILVPLLIQYMRKW